MTLSIRELEFRTRPMNSFTCSSAVSGGPRTNAAGFVVSWDANRVLVACSVGPGWRSRMESDFSRSICPVGDPVSRTSVTPADR